jgi:hypothetical protein
LQSITKEGKETRTTQQNPLYPFMYALKSSEARRLYQKRLKMWSFISKRQQYYYRKSNFRSNRSIDLLLVKLHNKLLLLFNDRQANRKKAYLTGYKK